MVLYKLISQWVYMRLSCRLGRNTFKKYWSRGRTINSLAWDARSFLAFPIYLASSSINIRPPIEYYAFAEQILYFSLSNSLMLPGRFFSLCLCEFSLWGPAQCHSNETFPDETKLLISSFILLLYLDLLTSLLTVLFYSKKKIKLL